MPDVYAIITELDAVLVERLAQAMEISAADPQHREMVTRYLDDLQLDDLQLDDGARVLEVGCGTGAISRIVADRPGAREVVGVDPSPLLLEKARQLSDAIGNLSFEQGEATATGLRV